ncbi:MAG: hypothetical protein ACE5K0_11875 [Candidatus Methanofastidiosia archaeon]
MSKKKKYINWARYENSREKKGLHKVPYLSDTEIKALKGFVVTSGNKHESSYLEELIKIVELVEALLVDSGCIAQKSKIFKNDAKIGGCVT